MIGAVLVHGAKAPHVVTREQLGLMKKNAVLVDVSIDQGGCFETSRPTTHSDPTYEVDGITHYCVANMPGAVPITSTYALTNATMPYVVHVADRGAAGAAADNPGLAAGFNVVAGKVTYKPVAEATGQEYTPLFDVLEARAAWAAQPLLQFRAECRRPHSSCARAARPRRRSSRPLASSRARAARSASPPRSGAASARVSTRPRRRSRTPRCARSPVCA